MTRKEAIAMLKSKLDGHTDTSYEWCECVRMAIKALKQEPCEDYISRDMALEKMSDYVASGYANSAEDFEEYSNIICRLPSVQPKTGHWIDKERQIVPIKDGFVSKSCWCSECGKWLTASDEYSCYGNYCPNCGRQMGGEDMIRSTPTVVEPIEVEAAALQAAYNKGFQDGMKAVLTANNDVMSETEVKK